MLTILLARGARIWGAVFIVVALIAASQLAYLFASHVEMLRERFHEKSIRAAVYNVQLLDDFWRTKFIGDGPRTVVGGVGVTPHNTFIATHLDYGGPAAWIYIFWMITLGIRVCRMFLQGDYPMDTRMTAVAMFALMLGVHLFNNFGWSGEGMAFPLSIIEKYTGPYSRRRMMERRMQGYASTPMGGTYPAYVSYPV